jgi:hypothetical protein
MTASTTPSNTPPPPPRDPSPTTAGPYAAFAAQTAVPAKDGPRGTEEINVTFPLTYTWDYATTRNELRALYEKAMDAQWNARTYLAWDTPVDPEAENVPDTLNPLFTTPLWAKIDKKKELPNLRRHLGAYTLSNFLHGEQGALLAAAQIVNAAPTAEAKFYSASQVYDEARHVEAYDRYLREKYELIYPISPHLKYLLDTILTDSRWDFKYLGMQIMVEGVALAAFGMIQSQSTEPLIKTITEMIMIDESRHVAFGVLALKDAFREMKASELRDREDFILEASKLLRDRFLSQEVWARVGLPQKECEEASDKSEFMTMFRKMLFSKIVPNVKRLGLLTPYVRKGFEELGVIEFETWEPSA